MANEVSAGNKKGLAAHTGETPLGPGGTRHRRDMANLIIWTIILLILGIATVYSLERIIGKGGHQSLKAITICLAAIFTLMIFTFLYKENPIYRLGEHIIVGIGIGYGLSRTISGVLIPNWWDLMVGAHDAAANWWWLLVIPPGLLWYTQLSKKYMWLMQLLIAFFMGCGCGIGFRGTFNVLLQEDIGQIPDTIRSVAITYWDIPSIWTSVSNLLFIIIVLCVLSYFFFSFRHEKHKMLRTSSKMGRIFLMVAFGAIFGTTVQGRMSIFIDRLRFLIEDWLKL